MQAIKRMWIEDEGVLSFEWVLLVTLLTIGIVSGLAAARDAIIDELGDVAAAAICLDQSYTLLGIEIDLSDPPDGIPEIDIAGSMFTDDTAADKAAFVECDRTTGPAGQGPEIDVDS